MKPSKILKRAAEEIEKEWHQESYGEWEKSHGPVCAVGALSRVTQISPFNIFVSSEGAPNPDLQTNLAYAANSLQADIQAPEYSHTTIHAWNDRDGNDQKKVAKQFRKTAKRLKALGR